MPESEMTLIELAYRKTGSMIKAAKVIAFLHSWQTTTDELGRPPTMEEYAASWGISEATAYRHKAEFREVFDKVDSPTEVLEFLAAQGVSATGRRLNRSAVNHLAAYSAA